MKNDGLFTGRKACSYLLLIDLDHFKSINDSLGQDIGDCLMQSIAGRISQQKNTDSLLVRLGGDEFVVVGTECDDKDQCRLDAEALAQKILLELKGRYVINLHQFYISASVGVILIIEKITM